MNSVSTCVPKPFSNSSLKSKNNCHTMPSIFKWQPLSNHLSDPDPLWQTPRCKGSTFPKALLLRFRRSRRPLVGACSHARAPACPGRALGLRRSRFPVGTSGIPAPANQAPSRPAGLRFRKRRICGSQTEA